MSNMPAELPLDETPHISHVRGKEHECRFRNADQLLGDFWSDVKEMLK